MIKKYLLKTKYLLLLIVTAATFSACGEPPEAPEVVIQKAKQAYVDLNSGSFNITMNFDGIGEEEDVSLDVKAKATFDKSRDFNQKLDLDLEAAGYFDIGGQVMNGELSVGLIALGDQYYVNLDKLSSNDPNFAIIEPFLGQYTDKWLHISDEVVPESIREIQRQDDAKKEQLEELFLESELFDVVKEHGIEKFNGRNVYRYGLAINVDNFKDYMQKLATLDGDELSERELEGFSKIASSINSLEVYIDTEDYYVVKLDLDFSGNSGSRDDNLPAYVADLNLFFTIEGSDFNEVVDIAAPENAEEFNPLNLMGLAVPTENVGAEDDLDAINENESEAVENSVDDDDDVDILDEDEVK